MEFTDVQFKESIYDYDISELKYTRPVVVDFVAEWCGSCKNFAIILDRVAQKFIDRVDFIKVDITKADNLVRALDIQSVPTIMFYQPGTHSPIKILIGAMNAESLERAVTTSFVV